MYPFSTITQLKADNAVLKKQLSDSEAENQRLQNELAALNAELNEQQAKQNDDYKEALLACAVSGLLQVQGIRETVFESFSRIETESQSIGKAMFGLTVVESKRACFR